MDIALIEKWADMKEFLEIAKGDKYETVIIDPIGELMDKLKRYMVSIGDSKLTQKDGSPTMAGWGWLKKTLRDYLKVLRDSGKHVIIVAHLDETKDEDRVLKRPKVETKLSDELVSMVDVVGYMTVVQKDGEDKRVIIVDPGNDKYTAKDRTGQLSKFIEPNFTKIINACQGNETYAWSKPQPQKEVKKEVDQNPLFTEEQQNMIDEEQFMNEQISDSNEFVGPVKQVKKEEKPLKKLSNPHLEAARKKMLASEPQ